MKKSDQLLLEQAYDEVYLETVRSDLTSQEISDNYSMVSIEPTDIPMLIYALKETGLQTKGVRIISMVHYPLNVYLIIPKTVESVTDHLGRINFVRSKIVEVIQPRYPKRFSYTTIPTGMKHDWNEITDRFHKLIQKLPELEGIF